MTNFAPKGALVILGALAFSQGLGLAAFAEGAPSWCQIDDPAGWAAERRKLIEAGSEELDNIPCPEPAPPAVLAAEIVLPMPCGRQMVFRRVDVPVHHPLDHIEGNFGRIIDIASETPQSVLSNSPWIAPVSGGFSLSAEGEAIPSDHLNGLGIRAYYVAKYELTEPQWQLFEMGLLDKAPGESASASDGHCAPYADKIAAGDLRQIPAKGGLSWYDSVNFGRAYNAWLMALDRDRIAKGQPPHMPWEQGATGYLRLPTEAEWEYAARGGSAWVSAQNRSMRYYAVEDSSGQMREATLKEICAEAPRSGPPRLAAVGTRLPNVLGLYDTVCNAEEIVLDLFRPTRPDGLAGQVGGVLTKGGSSLFLREQNTLGRRTEAAALFTTHGEGASPAMGARYMISAPVFPGRRDAGSDFVEGRNNQPFEIELMAGRETLLQGGAVGEGGEGSKLLAEEVGRLRREISERDMSREELMRQTSELQVQMDRLSAALGQKDREAAIFSIRSGVMAGNLMDRVGRNVFNAMDQLSVNEAAMETQREKRDLIAKFMPQIAINSNRIDDAYDLYLQVQIELAKRPAAYTAERLAETRAQMLASGQATLIDSLVLFESHHAKIRDQRGQLTPEMRQELKYDLDTTRLEREEKFPTFH